MKTNQMLQNDDTTALVLLVAIEMSLKTWHLAVGVQGGAKQRHKTVEGGDYAVLNQAIKDTKSKLGLADDAPVALCYEGGEKSALRVLNVPSVEAEDARQLPKERKELLKDLQQVWKRIVSLLFSQGHGDVPGSVRGLKRWLAERQDVGEYLRARLERELARLELLETQLKAVENRQQTCLQNADGDDLVELAWCWLRYQPDSARRGGSRGVSVTAASARGGSASSPWRGAWRWRFGIIWNMASCRKGRS